MTILAIPPNRVEDIGRAKDFLFAAFGEARWTEEKYLTFSDSLSHLVELSEGRLIVLDMPTPRHQDIAGNIYVHFRQWAAQHGGKAFVAPTPVRLWPDKFREPDVILYTAEHLDRVGDQFGGPPDLVVEVLSPGTATLDMHDKRTEYAQAAIPEYWIVDVEQGVVEQHVLETGHYRLHARFGPGSQVQAATLPELALSLVSIFSGN